VPTLTTSENTLAQLDALASALGVDSPAVALEALCASEGLMRIARNRLAYMAQLRESLDRPMLRPQEPISPTPAVIGAVGEVLVAAMPERHEGFRLAVRAAGLRWSGRRWERRIGAQAGPIADRVVELACRVLRAGFVVQLPSEEIRARVERGDYRPERTRWVDVCAGGTYDGWFRISWAWGEDLYGAAKAIHGARYEKPHVVAPPESADEVEDFAQMYNFGVTDTARVVIERQADLYAGLPVAAPELQEDAAEPEPFRPTLPADYGIDDALVDAPL
jgi:hypothetical protein